ncbi:MAG: hypothetical protein ABI572_12580 [Actinomycetota bacterium]
MSADRLCRLDDEALAEALRAAGADLRWPATPDLESAVRRSVATTSPRPGVNPVWPALPRRRRLVVLIAVALVLLGGVALAAKLAIDLGAVTIISIPGRPTSLPTDAITADDLGRPVSLAESARLTGVTPRVPRHLGLPDVVWTEQGQVGFDQLDTAPWIAMAWDAKPGLRAIDGTSFGALLIQFHGQAEVATKVLNGEAGTLRQVRLAIGPGYWIDGPHEFRIPIDGTLRAFSVDGHILVWQHGEDTFRLEAELSRPEAIDVADSVP